VSVALLSGGTGGAKLARGLYELLGEELAVIANTGDDLEIYGACVSPDPDLVSFWLADRIDERGWGIAGDSFNAMAMLRELGREVEYVVFEDEGHGFTRYANDVHAYRLTCEWLESHLT